MELRLFVFILFLLCVFAGWTTKSSVPKLTDSGAACYYGGKLVHFLGLDTHIYTLADDQWTTSTKAPTFRWITGGETAANGVFYVLGGVSPGPVLLNSLNEAFSIATGTWTTKSSIPFAGNGGRTASDGIDRLWYGGAGFATYHTITDLWTSRQPIPSLGGFDGVAYTDNHIVCLESPGTTLNKYSVVTDTWTIVSPAPAPTAIVYDIAAFFGVIYVTSTSDFYGYTFGTDQWSILDSPPSTHRRVSHTATPMGVFSIGHYFPGSQHKIVELYWPEPTFSLKGDPMVTTRDGCVVHVDLFPGVISLLDSQALSLTAVFDELSTLPPEENIVMVMVGATFTVPGGTAQVDCVALQEDSQHSSCHAEYFPVNKEDTQDTISWFHINENRTAISLALPDYHVVLLLHCLSALVVTEEGGAGHWLPPALFWDVSVLAASSSAQSLGGLLPSLTCKSQCITAADYEVHDGALIDSSFHV